MTEMIVGLDPHKAPNTIAVLDRDETLYVRRRFENTAEGMVAMPAAVAEFTNRVWAVEGANGTGRSVTQRLVAAGETVVDVPAKLATRVPYGPSILVTAVNEPSSYSRAEARPSLGRSAKWPASSSTMRPNDNPTGARSPRWECCSRTRLPATALRHHRDGG